jgi:glycine/D-amino acid oxidase-like deaminating enzyme
MIVASFGRYVVETSHDHGAMTSQRVVVVGAGIVGAPVAARLAAAGLRVTLLDQDQPGCATSRWSFAWINSNEKGPRPYHDLNHAGMQA